MKKKQKNIYVDFFKDQPKDKVWTTEQILVSLAGLTPGKFTKADRKWAEDMTKSYIHERPLPDTQPPTERVIREGPVRKGGINPPPRTPRPKTKPRPQGRVIEKKNPAQKYPVVKVEWIESESGWGQRPDGCSLHLTKEDAEAYIKDYWDSEHKRNPSGEVPYEYSRNEGMSLVSVSKKLYDKIKKESYVRLWHTEES